MGEMLPRVSWPPPAHQGDLYPRGYGLYSLYSNDGGLYSPGGKLPPTYMTSPKVTEPLFTFTGGGHIPGIPLSPHPALQQLEVLTKTFTPPHEANNGHCFPSPVRTPRIRETPTNSPVTVIDLSTDSTKKSSVKQEGFDKKKTMPLKVGVVPCGKLGLPSPSGKLHSPGEFGKLGLPSPSGYGKIGLSSPGGRPVTVTPIPGGCSRTTPLSFRPPELVVKKEPLLSPVDGSVFLSPPSDSEGSKTVKIENESESLKDAAAGNLSELSLGRSRYPHSHLDAALHHPAANSPLLGAVYTGGGVLNDRPSNHMASWPAQAHNPTLWQYSAPLEQYPSCPPVGFQLIRDPMTGHLMLIPAASMEAVQRAILWPTYAGNTGQMVLPPSNPPHLLLESSVPPTPHLLLESSVPTSMDFMTPESAHQPGTPRRILIAEQPKLQPPTLIKVENSAECTNSGVVVTSCDNGTVYSKAALSSVASESVFYPPVVDSPARPVKLNYTETRAQAASPIRTSPVDEELKEERPTETTPIPTPVIQKPSSPVDVTGLQLLSNSIETHSTKVDELKSPPPPPPPTPLVGKPMGGFAMLCALAEQLRGCEVSDSKETTPPSFPTQLDTPPALPRQLDTPPISPMETGDLSPPILEKVTDITFEDSMDISRPPKLTPNCFARDSDSPVSDWPLSPKDAKEVDGGRKRSASTDFNSTASKKRKVGRPRKQFLTTEMMLMKKNLSEATKLRKIRPKLKAETKAKPTEQQTPPKSRRSTGETNLSTESRSARLRLNVASSKTTSSTIVNTKTHENSLTATQERLSNLVVAPEVYKPRLSVVMASHHLSMEQLPLRVLTAMGGLFYAGQLSAIRAPDVYGITIDGERGNRPHIFSREEILKDTILEVKPRSCTELPPGTRLCAYWSEQYRCLYPGTVTAATDPEPDDDRFVSVEFDDGDSGRIGLDDIRLLPPHHPILENDPNPLLSLSKRKRRTSSPSMVDLSKELRVPIVKLEKIDRFKQEPLDAVASPPLPAEELLPIKEEEEEEEEEVKEEAEDTEDDGETEVTPVRDPETERRHLKKKRREKLKRLQSLSADGTTLESLSSEMKKKHKKHKCSSPHHHRHHKKHRKHRHRHRERLESTESRSKMAAFLPAKQLWGWADKGNPRPGARGRAKKTLHKAIRRGRETIEVGDCAVFLSTGRPDRPYIGRIVSLWESWCANMVVKVKWFYHPEETAGAPASLKYPGALFESPHQDENDVQTISHKCEVLPLEEYTSRLGEEPWRYDAVYENNDVYYLAGYYDPTTTTLKMEPHVE